MQCHTSLYYVMYLGTLLFPVQRNVFISLLWFLFSDEAGNQNRELVEIPVEHSTLSVIFKMRSRIIAIKKFYVAFKNRNV